VRVIGVSLSDFHERAYAILIDAAATHEEPKAALAALQPWLIVAFPFAVAWAAIDIRRGMLVVATVAVSLGCYIAYNDFWPYNLLRLSLIHYVVWTLPLLSASAVAGATSLIRGRRWIIFGAVTVAAAALAVLRPVAAAVATTTVSIEPLPNGRTRYEMTFDRPQDIDAIDLVGAGAQDQRAVTLKSFDISADGRPMRLFSGYRPLQLRHGLRFWFNRHVEASRIDVTLDNTIANHPTDARGVRAVGFTLSVVPRPIPPGE
jgi:hypothetical protein